METKSAASKAAEVPAPKVGDLVRVHVPGRKDPLRAHVTAVFLNTARPPALSLLLELPDKSTTTLTAVEHVSRREPFGGWEAAP